MSVPKGVIVSFRRGPKTQKAKECLVKITGIESTEVGHLIGRRFAWPIGERKCRGRVIGLHGKKGVIRVRFKKGVPGKALGTQIEIIG